MKAQVTAVTVICAYERSGTLYDCEYCLDVMQSRGGDAMRKVQVLIQKQMTRGMAESQNAHIGKATLGKCDQS